MLSILLALASAMAWGISDFLGGQNSRYLALTSVLLTTQVVGVLLLAPLAVLHGPPILDSGEVVQAVGGSISGLIGIASLYRAMSIGSVSIVAPISATGAALPVLYGLLRGERAAAVQLIGIALALIGIALASRVADKTGPMPGPKIGPGVGLALLAALGFGGFFVLLHQASAHDFVWAAFTQRLTGMTIMIGLTLWRRPDLRAVRRRVLSVVAAGVLDTSANVLFVLASVTGLVSLAAVLASLFPVATVLLARVVLSERLSPSQTLGVVCALAGAGCIASG